MISAIRTACSSLSITHGPAIRKRFPEPIWTSPTWKEEIKSENLLTAEHAESAEIEQERSLLPFSAHSAISAINLLAYLRATFSGRWNISTAAVSFCARRFEPCSYAAAMNVLNSGCGSSGFDLNSG